MATNDDAQNDNLRMYVNDTTSMARHIENAFDQQRGDDDVRSHTTVHHLIETMHGVLASQRQLMERHAAEVGGGVGATLKEAVTSIAGVLAGLYGKVRKHPLSRILRDNYTALSLACVAYEMLHTTALGMGETALAETALRNLRELSPMVMNLTKLMPDVVLQELACDGGGINLSVAAQARENIIGAWEK